jgi:hypothetical protein
MVEGKISRSIMAPVHRSFPQTSDFAEHIAICFVSLHASPSDPIEVVTDCASVISYFRQAHEGQATSYKNVLGGVWDEVNTDTITQVHKIKSHMSYDKACSVGVGQWWAGNAQADALAQKAAERAMIASAEASSYTRLVARAEKFIRDIAHALIHWKGDTVRHHELEKVEVVRDAGTALPKHQYEWDHAAQAWTCSKCWKRRKRSENDRPDRSGCKAISRADARRLHASHTLRFAQGPWGAKPLMYCLQCGHYTTTRLAALSKPCRGKHTATGELTSAYRLFVRTVGRGRLPGNKKHSIGHTYTPSLVGSEHTDSSVSLATDVRAAQLSRLVPLAGPPGEAELAEELLEIEYLEQEAARLHDPADGWMEDLLHEADLAHGFLSLDEA